MSSDLLAEFDSFYQAPQKNQSSTNSASNDLSILGGSGGNTQAGQTPGFSQWQPPEAQSTNDIWGGMTGFQSTTSVQPAVGKDMWSSFETPMQDLAPSKTTSRADHGSNVRDSGEKPSIVRRPTLDLFSSDFNETSQHTQPKTALQAQPLRPAPVTNSSYGEVLFDADELEEGDDDFGDFETGTSEPTHDPLPPSTSQSLAGIFGANTLESNPTREPLDFLSAASTPTGDILPYPHAPKSPTFQERNPFADLGIATTQASAATEIEIPHSATPVTVWPSFEPQIVRADPYNDSPLPENEEEWGDFADMPSETPPAKQSESRSGIEADAWGWDTADQVSQPTPAPKQANVTPPTNIPPPSVILALFPALFDLPQSTLFKAVANQPFSLKNRIISDTSTVDFLRGYLLIAVVAARIIAGRKLRWKRDILLSQAMKIGPAAAGGKSGMKLAGVDKAEVTREDREAADVVRIWKEHLGRLRSAIAVANSSMHDTTAHLSIPDISENMYVKTQEGGLTAPKQCLICGLKREERINKVDVQVEDSFGEWWVDHWGHRACRNFWLENESNLRRR